MRFGQGGSATANPRKMIQEITKKILADGELSRVEAEGTMDEILAGRAAESEIVDFLSAMRKRQPSVDELVGFATAMRRAVRPIFDGAAPAWADSLVDTCG